MNSSKAADVTDLKEARGPQLFEEQPETNHSTDASAQRPLVRFGIDDVR
jgi:hypothetical protein